MDILARAGTAVIEAVPAAYARSAVTTDTDFRTNMLPPDVTAGIGSPRASAGSFTEALLSPTSMTDVLKLADVPAFPDTTEKPLSDRATLLNAIKQSKAFAAGEVSASKSLADRYTSQDIALIRATTGYNVVTKGALTAIVDDDGNPPPPDISAQVWQMADKIEWARGTGGLTGEVSTEYLKEMFEYYKSTEAAFNNDWLDKARRYLDSVAEAEQAKA